MGFAKIRDEGIVGAGGYVRVGREARGLTQAELADKTGLAVADLKDIERDARRPTEREFGLLCFALGFPKKFFLREDQPPGRFEPWFCGEDIVACDRCEYVADYLCDHPMGEGETCDLPLCDRHAITQDELHDIHFCPQHSIIDKNK